MALPLFDSASGTTMTIAIYQEDAEISSHIASGDLRILADPGILDARGDAAQRLMDADKIVVHHVERDYLMLIIDIIL